MKFVCDACGARYHIDDKKVRGKMLRIRCKKCSHVITVREPDRPQPRVVAPQPEPVPATVEWFYSVNGETLGPHDEEGLIAIFRSGSVGDEAYVWHAGFGDWKPAFNVPVFQSAISAAKQASIARGAPRTERLDAIDVDNLKLESRAMGALGGTDPRLDPATTPVRADIGHDPDDTVLVDRARPAPSDSTSSSRLEALRAGLRDRRDRRTTMTSEERELEEARRADERAPLLDELAQSGGTEPAPPVAEEPSPHAAITTPAPQPAFAEPVDSEEPDPALATAPLKRAKMPEHGAFGAPEPAETVSVEPSDPSSTTADPPPQSEGTAEAESDAQTLRPDPNEAPTVEAERPSDEAPVDGGPASIMSGPGSETPTVEVTPGVAPGSEPAGEEPTVQLQRDEIAEQIARVPADTTSDAESERTDEDGAPLAPGASIEVSPLGSLDLEELDVDDEVDVASPTGGHATAPPIPAAATGGHPAAPPIPAAATGGHPAAPPIPAAATGSQPVAEEPPVAEADAPDEDTGAPTVELDRPATSETAAVAEATEGEATAELSTREAASETSEAVPSADDAEPETQASDDDSGGFAALAASLTTAPTVPAREPTPAPPIGGVGAPMIGASADDGAPTESLVFQVKQARSRNRRTVAVVLLGLVIVGAVAAALLMNKPTTPTPTPAVVVNEGSDDEGSGAAQADDTDTSDAPLQVEQSAAAAATSARNLEVAHVRARRGVSRAVASALEAAAAAAPTDNDSAEDSNERDDRQVREDRPPVRSNERDDEGIGSDDSAPDRLAVNTDPSTGNSRIDRQLGVALPLPSPAFDTEDRGSDGPGGEHFAEGLRTFVNNSIVRCNQRHVAEEGALEQPRVELQLTVQPSGRVTSATLPRELRDTAFGRCMQTHRERWMFPSFDGESVTLSKTYVVQ